MQRLRRRNFLICCLLWVVCVIIPLFVSQYRDIDITFIYDNHTVEVITVPNTVGTTKEKCEWVLSELPLLEDGYHYVFSTTREKHTPVEIDEIKSNTTIFILSMINEYSLHWKSINGVEIIKSHEAIIKHGDDLEFSLQTAKTLNKERIRVLVNDQYLPYEETGIYKLNDVNQDYNISLQYVDELILTYEHNQRYTYNTEVQNFAYTTNTSDVSQLQVKYYLDEACKQATLPINAGLYYVVIDYLGYDKLFKQIKDILIIEKQTPVISEVPEYHSIYETQYLVRAGLNNGIANVEGTFVWAYPDMKLTPGVQNVDLVFLPDDRDNYETVVVSVPIEVYQAEIALTHSACDKEALQKEYCALPPIQEGFVLRTKGSEYGANINWYSISTAVSVKNNIISIIFPEGIYEMDIVLYAAVEVGDSVEYLELHLTVTDTISEIQEEEKVEIPIIIYEANDTSTNVHYLINYEVVDNSINAFDSIVSKSVTIKQIRSQLNDHHHQAMDEVNDIVIIRNMIITWKVKAIKKIPSDIAFSTPNKWLNAIIR